MRDRPVVAVTPRSWRRGRGGWITDDLFHFFPNGQTYACQPYVHLGAGEVATEGDPLCPECVTIAQEEFQKPPC